MEVVMSYLQKYVFQKKKRKKDINVKVFTMVTNRNKAKIVEKHISCDYKCKPNSITCNSTCSNKICQFECKNCRKCKKRLLLESKQMYLWEWEIFKKYCWCFSDKFSSWYFSDSAHSFIRDDIAIDNYYYLQSLCKA